jgi:hypothetical protein
MNWATITSLLRWKKHWAWTLQKRLPPLRFRQKKAEASNARIVSADNEMDIVKFTVENKYLPLPSPQSASWIVDNARIVRISGLKKGYYTLTSENNDVASASAKEWGKGC